MHIRNGLLLAALAFGMSNSAIDSLAQEPERPVAVEAQPDNGGPPADQGEAKAEAEPSASPFEIRYLISYVLMLLFIGGSTVLIIRPSKRAIQGDLGGATKAQRKT